MLTLIIDLYTSAKRLNYAITNVKLTNPFFARVLLRHHSDAYARH